MGLGTNRMFSQLGAPYQRIADELDPNKIKAKPKPAPATTVVTTPKPTGMRSDPAFLAAVERAKQAQLAQKPK